VEKYVIVGVEGRSMMFTEGLSKRHYDSSRLVVINDAKHMIDGQKADANVPMSIVCP
jgi:hypothetical protein